MEIKIIGCETLDLAANGKAIFLTADNVKTDKSIILYQIGGLIRNCIFNLLLQLTSLNRLNALTFKKVTWIFSPNQNSRGYFVGTALRGQYGEPWSAIFIQNIFKVNGNLIINPLTKVNTDSIELIGMGYQGR